MKATELPVWSRTCVNFTFITPTEQEDEERSVDPLVLVLVLKFLVFFSHQIQSGSDRKSGEQRNNCSRKSWKGIQTKQRHHP